MALDDEGKFMTAENRPAFPLKLPVGLAICANGHTIDGNLFSKWRFQLKCL
jgi:hypothetical protein